MILMIFFRLSIKFNNFDIFKYLVDNYDFLIHNSFNIVNYFFNNNNNIHINIIKYLADKGAEIYTNGHLISILNILYNSHKFDVIDYLINIKIKQNMESNENLEKFLEMLISSHESSIIEYLLENYKEYITNYVNFLKIVCDYGICWHYIFKLLLRYFEPDNDLLIYSYNKNNLSAVQLLVEYGMDFNILDEYIKDENKDINNYLFGKGLVLSNKLSET